MCLQQQQQQQRHQEPEYTQSTHGFTTQAEKDPKPPRVRVYKPIRLESDPSTQTQLPTPISLTQFSFNPTLNNQNGASDPKKSFNLSHSSSIPHITNNKRKAKPRQLQHQPPSLISQIGSYVKGSLTQSHTTQNASPSSHDSLDHILCAKFSQISDDLALLIGYENGFQIWSISSSNGIDVTQIASIKSGLGRIVDLDVIPYNTSATQQQEYSNQPHLQNLPLVVLGENNTDPVSADFINSNAKLYSLKTHSNIAVWSFSDEIVSVKSSERLIVIALSNYTLQVYSAITLLHIAAIKDAHPVYAVGARLLAYASTTRAPKQSKLGDGDISGDEYDEYGRLVGASTFTVQEKAMEGLKKTTKKVVKEVIVGAGYLGNVGYTAMTNYLNGTTPTPSAATAATSNAPAAQAPIQQPNPEKLAEGTIAILDFPPNLHFQSPSTTTTTDPLEPTLISHWKPHTNKLSNLTFNTPQTLLFSSSTSGNTFFIFGMIRASPGLTEQTTNGKHTASPSSSRSLIHQQCLYKLERGYTPATIESVAFSENGKWCAVSTARGTSHLYPLPPLSRSESLGGISSSGSAAAAAAAAAVEIGVLNGWTETKSGPVDVFNAALKGLAGTSSSGGSGCFELYPCARVKQSVPFGEVHSEEVANEASLQQHEQNHRLQRKSRASLSVGFLFDCVGNPVYGSGSGGGAAGVSVSPSLTGFLGGNGGGGGGEDQVRLFRQRVFSFHPNGFLTLHYLDIHAGVNTGGAYSASAGVGMSVGSLGNRFNSSSVSPMASGAGVPSGRARASVKDVLAVGSKIELEPAKESPSPWKSGQWASQIETTTYNTVLFGAPIWMDMTFKMHLYSNDNNETVGLQNEMNNQVTPDLSDLPLFRKLETSREVGGVDSLNVPTMADSCIAPAITSAMADELGGFRVWQRDDVSFEDALVVEEDEGNDESGQIGYFDKISNQYRKGRK
ncbi:hypothetical protein BDR26DRAFT_865521 [Obelidium mucronatum]|nr:hypothetical protein BDR26DRAFT_865521 [Obelidium mucronatum]